jgi:arylsulfatase A-like enzyme
MTPFAIYRDEEILHDAPFDQTRMNEVYTRAAVEFLEEPREAPFFLYFAHNFPHVPLHTPDSDRGRSGAGLYGDVIEGLDDSVGAILDVLERRGELDDTLILLTSDNGPWFEGSPGPVRGRKGQTWEGGMHVPFIAHWPARIQAGRRSNAPIVGVDLVPTLLALLGLPPPRDRVLDGRDVGGHLFDEAPAENRLVHYFGVAGTFDAIRDARFKYHRRRGVRAGGRDGYSFGQQWGPWLFDLSLDAAESYDVTRTHPEEAARLARLFEAERAERAANPRGWRSP